MFIELTIDKFQIINIFPDSAFQKILALGNKEIQQINHTPTQAQEMIDLEKSNNIKSDHSTAKGDNEYDECLSCQ